ncbi:hypothetical protein CYMTET_4190 [Cymbomonas tetramitiformis]|uniref:Uncharacterized protein n=1 Tax=Cymbomonas tetramitiformis TaxID=36881 RepID=A0AAE0H235_9CHLO|nr:hypothetical protein CYMTET_43344 [Cymbomonas tetramitiformis]KAK3288300.1 hypothetical protein CYMTET_4190 [Cymbomonas tetramitiformis]
MPGTRLLKSAQLRIADPRMHDYDLCSMTLTREDTGERILDEWLSDDDEADAEQELVIDTGVAYRLHACYVANQNAKPSRPAVVYDIYYHIHGSRAQIEVYRVHAPKLTCVKILYDRPVTYDLSVRIKKPYDISSRQAKKNSFGVYLRLLC